VIEMPRTAAAVMPTSQARFQRDMEAIPFS
jgi:hypothetical protein